MTGVIDKDCEARALSELLARRAEDFEVDEPGDIPVAEPVVVELSEDGWGRLNEHTRSVANPTKALPGGPRDDIDRLHRRMDDLRVWLSGHTWRDGVDRDEVLEARRAELAGWYGDCPGRDNLHGHGHGATDGGEQ